MADWKHSPEEPTVEEDSTACGPALVLPPRASAQPPSSPVDAANEMAISCLAGIASFASGLAAYAILASRDLDFFLFDIPSFNELVGDWSYALAYLFACCCCVPSIGVVRLLRRRHMSAGVAIALGVSIGTFFAVLTALIVAAVVGAILSTLGIAALFFHSGSR